jgi:hypothetical protein
MAEINVYERFKQQNENEKILKFITGLNIFKKNIGIYPSGHPAIKTAAEALSEMLGDIFADTPVITINAIKNNLLINGQLFDAKSVHTRDFTLFISKLGIASLTINKGLSGEELEMFCHKALLIPQHHHIYQFKDILDDINASNHIKVREIDLAAVRFIDEESVDSSQAKLPLTIWQKLMLCCLSPELNNINDSALLKTIKVYDQGSLSNYIQAFNIPEERLLQGYKIVLDDHFRSFAGDEEDLNIKKDFFLSLNKAFGDFSKELKEEVLSVTFDALNNSMDEESLEEFLGCIPGDMVVEILTQAVLSKRIISPTLIKLLSILYRAGKHTNKMPGNESPGNRPVWDRIEELFSREGYEKYLSKEYAEQLQNLSMGEDSSQEERTVGFVSEKHLEAFQEKNINRRLVLSLLFLLRGDLDEQIYCDYAEIIRRTIPEMLQTADYKNLAIIYKSLQKQLDADKEQAANEALTKTLHAYKDQDFTSMLAAAYSAAGSEQNPELEELITLSGADNLPWLINQYTKQRNTEIAQRTLKLISPFGYRAAEIALDKLDETEGEETIALLKLIRSSAGGKSTARVLNLLKSSDPAVRLEAIKNLLESGDNSGLAALRKMIHSRDYNMLLEALKILNEYKVNDLSPELASQVKIFYISASSLVRNKAILAFLGSLGNPAILPLLGKKAKARLSLSQKNLCQTQEYLYKTLSGYPAEDIEELVRYGLKSKNEIIWSICEQHNQPDSPDEAAGENKSA